MRNASAMLTLLMLISSCATDRLNNAATTQGKISAGISLPALPSDCRVQEPHAPVKVGDELRSALIQERSALRRSNARVTRCGNFYDDVKHNYGSAVKGN